MICQDADGNWVHIDQDGNPVTHKGLARNEDPGTSHEAAEQVDASKLMERIYDVMLTFGERGCIGDEVDDLMPDVVPQSITPRYATMVNLGMIEVTGEKRLGHKCKRNQMVRRCVPRGSWMPVSRNAQKQRIEDMRITRARDIVRQMRSTVSMMCSEDRVRMNFQIGRLEEVLK